MSDEYLHLAYYAIARFGGRALTLFVWLTLLAFVSLNALESPPFSSDRYMYGTGVFLLWTWVRMLEAEELD